MAGFQIKTWHHPDGHMRTEQFRDQAEFISEWINGQLLCVRHYDADAVLDRMGDAAWRALTEAEQFDLAWEDAVHDVQHAEIIEDA